MFVSRGVSDVPAGDGWFVWLTYLVAQSPLRWSKSTGGEMRNIKLTLRVTTHHIMQGGLHFRNDSDMKNVKPNAKLAEGANPGLSDVPASNRG